jgi:hypothetical protein
MSGRTARARRAAAREREANTVARALSTAHMLDAARAGLPWWRARKRHQLAREAAMWRDLAYRTRKDA